MYSFSDLDFLINKANLACAPELPISSVWDELLKAIKDNQVLILTGETGSGKTTQLPKACLAAGRGRAGKVVCTQPRRIAAITISERLSEELGPVGSQLVGYKIRFRDRTGPSTRIQYVTDGLLLSEFHKDPYLRQYDTIIVDEAHERSLNIDVLLGILRKLLPRRPDLKTIITSATIDVALFARAFSDAPVIEIKGRTFPVETFYRPMDELDDLSEKVSLAIEEIKAKDPLGDILVFLPTEQDINETIRMLKGRYKGKAIVLPLFSRLSHRDQKLIFKPSGLPKIIVATNIAETSLTVPGIRYVVDSGLARISLYNARIRAMTLPVTDISRASADQRSGRAGRLGPGTCIRLFKEEDYEARPLYTPPEILRSNLSDVILRLTALNLTPVEEFPFIEPPSVRAIFEGKYTLKEIGALDEKERLTKTGRILSRLPLDPRIARMIYQARYENALREILVIASALSIQDPRERPKDSAGAAQNAHASFTHPLSDFMTLLSIWNAYEKRVKSRATKKEIKEFAKSRFLSYSRLLEWRDIHEQLKDIQREAGGFHIKSSEASYEAIHRSIISGFLSQVAMKKEGPLYMGANGKEIYLHPGSSIYKKRPQWIVASDMVRTSRLYARTAAQIEPAWVVDLAAHLTKAKYLEPHWEKERGEAVAWKRIILFGLPLIEKNKVSYKKIDQEVSKAIFIEVGLSQGNLKGTYSCLKENLKTQTEAKELEYKLRRPGLISHEEAMVPFYEKAIKRLEKEAGISPVLDEASFANALKKISDDSFLRITRDELIKGLSFQDNTALYPGFLKIEGIKIPLRYRFQPGDKEDGITARLPIGLIKPLSKEGFEWLVPGFLLEKIETILKRLPKEIRKGLQPISKTAEDIFHAITGQTHGFATKRTNEGLITALRKEISIRYNLFIPPDAWPSPEELPPYLLMRFELIDDKGNILDAGRDFQALKEKWMERGKDISRLEPGLKKIKQNWEKSGYQLGNLPLLPEAIKLKSQHIKTAFPGYAPEKEGIGVKIFLKKDDAVKSSNKALRKLIHDGLKKELTYLKKHSLQHIFSMELSFFAGGEEALKERTIQMILDEVMGNWEKTPTAEEALELLNDLKKSIHQKAIPYLERIRKINHEFTAAYREIRRIQDATKGIKISESLLNKLDSELLRIITKDFPSGLNMNDLEHLPRYLKALGIRAQRAMVDPLKDRKKQGELSPYMEQLRELEKILPKTDRRVSEEFKQLKNLLEEYRISLFAPELGTVVKVSPKRLDEAIRRFKNSI